MNEPKIANALTCVDDDLIVEAMEITTCRKRNPVLRWGILAACLVLLIGTVTVAATTDLGEWLLDGFFWETKSETPDQPPYGYTVHLPIDRIPLSDLTGEIREVPSIVLEQIKNHQLWYSTTPTHFVKKFATPEDAKKYIGLDILQLPNLDHEILFTDLSAHCDSETGQIQWFSLMINHRADKFNVNTIITVYTELWEREAIFSTAFPESPDRTFTEELYTTANGLSCNVILEGNTPGEYQAMSAFLVDKGIMYSIHISFYEPDRDDAEEILHQWADQFGN